MNQQEFTQRALNLPYVEEVRHHERHPENTASVPYHKCEVFLKSGLFIVETVRHERDLDYDDIFKRVEASKDLKPEMSFYSTHESEITWPNL